MSTTPRQIGTLIVVVMKAVSVVDPCCNALLILTLSSGNFSFISKIYPTRDGLESKIHTAASFSTAKSSELPQFRKVASTPFGMLSFAFRSQGILRSRPGVSRYLAGPRRRKRMSCLVRAESILPRRYSQGNLMVRGF